MPFWTAYERNSCVPTALDTNASASNPSSQPKSGALAIGDEAYTNGLTLAHSRESPSTAKKRMTKGVLVLLAAHDGMRWIAQQVESIRAQDSCRVSILASDDASTDGTHEYLRAAPSVALLPERGPYGSAGRNFFHLLSRADFSGHDFVAFADQDDLWHPWKLARALECLEREGCDGYSANVTAFWEDGREALVDKAHPQRELDFVFEGPGPGCTFVMSTRLARQIQDVLRLHPALADEISLHDWFAYAWARSHGFAWFIDKK